MSTVIKFSKDYFCTKLSLYRYVFLIKNKRFIIIKKNRKVSFEKRKKYLKIASVSILNLVNVDRHRWYY